MKNILRNPKGESNNLALRWKFNLIDCTGHNPHCNY